MKVLKHELKNELNLRTQQDFPVKGVNFIDVVPLFIQKDTLKQIIDKFILELKEKDIDYIVAPESRGFLLGVSIASNLDIGFVPVRKKDKLPPTTVEEQFSYEKEYGIDSLELPKLVNDDYRNKKFYIVDDIYATGNTLTSIKKAIEALGGTVIGEGVILNIVELNDNKELFSLIDVNE